MKVTTRAGWRARAPKSRNTTSWSRRTEFVVHYSEGSTTQTTRQIQAFHMDDPKHRWSDIGYNFLVDKQGRIFEGRGWLVVGAHAKYHNTSGIGVCFIGRSGDATPAAKRSIRALYDEACRRAGRTLAKRGHGQLSGNNTDCPGGQLLAWVKAGMPVSGATPSPKPPPKPGTKAPKWAGVNLTQPPVRRGSSVRTWQQRMRDRGWDIDVDGAYGPDSERVCRAFQKEKGLRVTGIVDAKTWTEAWTAPVSS
jgi:hypothetical protein